MPPIYLLAGLCVGNRGLSLFSVTTHTSGSHLNHTSGSHLNHTVGLNWTTQRVWLEPHQWVSLEPHDESGLNHTSESDLNHTSESHLNPTVQWVWLEQWTVISKQQPATTVSESGPNHTTKFQKQPATHRVYLELQQQGPPIPGTQKSTQFYQSVWLGLQQVSKVRHKRDPRITYET